MRKRIFQGVTTALLALSAALALDAPLRVNSQASEEYTNVVSGEQAELIEQVMIELAAEQPKQALSLLAAWPQEQGDDGKPLSDPPIRWLLTARAHFALNNSQAGKNALRVALDLDPAKRSVWLELASREAADEAWIDALQAHARAWQLADRTQGEPTLGDWQAYAWTAWQAGDARLTRKLVDAAMLEYPLDQSLRELDVWLLIDSGDDALADQTLRSLLPDAEPDRQAEIWTQLAALRSEDNPLSAQALAAREAAALANPRSINHWYDHLSAQINAGNAAQALRDAKSFADRTSTSAILDQPEVIELLLYIAIDANAWEQAREWGSRFALPEPARNLRIMLAQIDAHFADDARALEQLWPLVERGQASVDVLLWVASLARASDQTGRQELALRAALAQAGGISADHAQLNEIVMRLASLLAANQRASEANDLLAARLQHAPDARRLRALSESLVIE